ncbi:efflux RND transporter periplasmic adaptor subunit [Nocardioides sp. NBC_00850]|uniref:efflux RND transporter periplasmic adaptor subunit n=1 Tax=Nocardioides sp. NBC_00850 TaxID=2976001 RepID=UPI00386B46B5|nr:efflux RND transporter periplasmic adaptor subunit [Nocardioides sp. NBC_00850]
MRKRLTERWRRLGRTARILLAAGVAAVVVGGGAGAWALTREDTAQAQAMQVQATSGTVKETVSAGGTVEAAETADLSFEVSGTVTKIYVAEGDTVKKGDPLARVDDTTLVAARTAAESALTAAQEQLDTDDSSGASDVQIASDEAAVAAAEADLDSARQAVDDAVLRATIGGTVTAFDIAVGDVVGSSSGSSGTSSGGSGSSMGEDSGGASTDSSTDSTSTGTVSIVSAGDHVVEATVSADDAASLKKGLQATVTVNGVDEEVFGTVATVGKVAETSSSGAAVFPVSITVTGERDDLYPGTSATAEITVKQREDVLTVTSAAITTDGDQAYVQKVVDGKTVKTKVTIGEVYGATTEITDGLAEGDTVEIEAFTRPGGSRSGSQEGGQEGGFGGFGGEGETGQLPGGGQFPGGGMPDQMGGGR